MESKSWKFHFTAIAGGFRRLSITGVPSGRNLSRHPGTRYYGWSSNIQLKIQFQLNEVKQFTVRLIRCLTRPISRPMTLDVNHYFNMSAIARCHGHNFMQVIEDSPMKFNPAKAAKVLSYTEWWSLDRQVGPGCSYAEHWWEELDSQAICGSCGILFISQSLNVQVTPHKLAKYIEEAGVPKFELLMDHPKRQEKEEQRQRDLAHKLLKDSQKKAVTADTFKTRVWNKMQHNYDGLPSSSLWVLSADRTCPRNAAWMWSMATRSRWSRPVPNMPEVQPMATEHIDSSRIPKLWREHTSEPVWTFQPWTFGTRHYANFGSLGIGSISKELRQLTKWKGNLSVTFGSALTLT